MKSYKTSELVWQKLILLIPLVLYSIYKNGYLIYSKNLISIMEIFKSLYLIGISIIIKIIFDLIRFKKIKFDYDYLSLILVAMIMPYNINILFYMVSVSVLYFITILLNKKIVFNNVCFIYLVIIGIYLFSNKLIFQNLLELNYSYSFSFLDFLIGRSVGGIASTSIFFSLIAYTILLTNYYYKKDIPFIINLTYLILTFIYFLITNHTEYLLNSEVIFASVFVCTLPISSPYKRINQIIYSILIGVLSFIVSIYYNPIISIYLVTFIISLFLNIHIRHNKTKN